MYMVALSFLLAALPVEPPPPGLEHGPPPINSTIKRHSVMTVNGSFTLSASDARIRDLDFTRTYNSNDPRSGSLGPGWTHNYAVHLADPGDGTGTVLVVGPQGRADRYVPTANGFDPPPGIGNELSKHEAGLQLRYRDLSRLLFDADGRLVAMLDRYDQATRLEYGESSGQLASVTAWWSGSLTFTYDGDRLISVVSALGQTTYDYDEQGRLSSVVGPSGALTQYTYDGDSARLSTWVNPNGHTVVTNTYDDLGRVAGQSDPIGVQTTYAYTPLPGGGLVVLTDEAGGAVQLEETFDAHGFLIRRGAR
ncbi:MAG TPA: DUF6531 domain-containing protein [Chloroflexota bacterium]